MTWFGFSAKSLSLIVVLPLILSNFSKSEISLWYLFSILFGFQMIADLGFGTTFTRIISYGMSGLSNLDSKDLKIHNKWIDNKPNWNFIFSVRKYMNRVYLVISIIFIFLITITSLKFLNTPIERLENPNAGYALLFLILVVLFFKVNNRKSVSFISGVNEVALLRRWEGIFTYLQIFSSIIILLTTSSFVLLVINNQLWIIIGVLRNIFIEKKIIAKNIFNSSNFNPNFEINKKNIKTHIFSPAIKSGIGVLSSYGISQFSAFVLIDFLSESDLIVYLISFRFISIISEFSRAPFYARIPYFNQLYKSGNKTLLLLKVKSSIDKSILLAIVCSLFILLFGDIVLELIKSSLKEINPLLWFLFSLNLVFERLGAMHFQMHSFSNKVIWHKANLIYGFIFIVISYFLIDHFGVYTVPIAMLSGNTFYYTFFGIKSTFLDYNYAFFKFNSRILYYTLVLILINTTYLFYHNELFISN